MFKQIKSEQINIWEWLRSRSNKAVRKKNSLRRIRINHRSGLQPSKIKTSRKRIITRKSDPFLEQIWLKLATQYFPNNKEIPTYSITWSSRPQKRTLASCNIENRKVNVARELNYPELHKWLEPLIYHEMCHAELKYIQKRNHRSWHGKEFKALEELHPQMAAFNAWVKSGGWLTAVRSDRGKRAARKRYG